MIKQFNFMLGVIGILTLNTLEAQVPTTPTVIKGTPYMQEAYIDGVIYYADKNMSAPIRYNAFKDLIEYQQNGKALVLDPTLLIQKVQLGSSSFVPHKYDMEGKSKLGYFELLDSGKVMLLSKRSIVYSAPMKGRAMDGGDLPAEYKRSPDSYYLKFGDGGLQQIKSIKETIAIFPDKKDELSQYAKKERISPKKEKELIQLVEFYNGLN